MTIIIRHNEGGTEVTVTRLEKVQMPGAFAQAFFLFKSLGGDDVFMVPIARVASMKFEDNTVQLAG
jgi:hypothetical protein